MRSTPGPSMPSVQLSSAAVTVQFPPRAAGDREERDAARRCVASDDVVRLVRAVVLARTVYAMSAWPLTSCTCGVAALITCTSMSSSVEGGGGGGGVHSCRARPSPSRPGPCWIPSMFGHTSRAAGGVTQLPCSSFPSPPGPSLHPSMFGHTSTRWRRDTVAVLVLHHPLRDRAWIPSMFGHTSISPGGVTQLPVRPCRLEVLLHAVQVRTHVTSGGGGTQLLWPSAIIPPGRTPNPVDVRAHVNLARRRNTVAVLVLHHPVL